MKAPAARASEQGSAAAKHRPTAAPGLVLGGTGLIGQGVERDSPRRSNDEWLAEAWADPRTRVLVIDDGKALARFSGNGSAELVLVPPIQAPDSQPRFLLGVDSHQIVYFGVGAPLGAISDGEQESGVRRAGLREAAMVLSAQDAALLTYAIAMANWHAAAGFCPRCGAATEPTMAGHVRRCTAEGIELFPRTDPAVIMLVTDADDRCLLARNANWPPRRVSVLAGFVEPGESAEHAVAREVREEVGLNVSSVSYAGSQPWPMPHSLMLGFRAVAAGTAIQVDADEIAEANWYSRDGLRDALLASEVLLPPSVSISRWLIETWYGSELPLPAKKDHQP